MIIAREEVALHHMLGGLFNKHQKLEHDLQQVQVGTSKNDLLSQRLKKEKLRLKDEMTRLNGILRPNIIA